MSSFLPNEEDALGATIESVELDESTSLTQQDFSHFAKKALWTQAILTLPSCIYFVLVDNLMIAYGIVAIAQIWFVTLVTATTFPLLLNQENNGQPWKILGATGLLAGALPLLAVLREAVLYCKGQRDTAELVLSLGYNVMALLILGLQLSTSKYMRLCMQQVCQNNEGDRELHWVTIQGMEAILKTGIIQVALLATLLVGTKTYSNQDTLESLEILLEQEQAENATTILLSIVEETSSGHDPEDVFDSFVLSLRATLAGLALNVFLVKGLVAKHISKLLVVDFVQGGVTWQEYTSLTLQLLVFASVSAIVSMSPKDILIGNQSFNLYQALLIFGVCAPCVCLWVGLLQYCRSWHSNGGTPKNEALARRQHRVSSFRGLGGQLERPTLDKGGESCQTMLLLQSQRTGMDVDEESPRLAVETEHDNVNLLEPEIVVGSDHEPTITEQEQGEQVSSLLEPEIVVETKHEHEPEPTIVVKPDEEENLVPTLEVETETQMGSEQEHHNEVENLEDVSATVSSRDVDAYCGF